MQIKLTASDAILMQLAHENRRVLSDWRATLLLRRATFTLPAENRRWNHIPTGTSEIYSLLRTMHRRGEIQPLKSLDHVYEVTVPYARTGMIEENEILMEVHPYTALSHLSALAFHELTTELPKVISTTIPVTGSAGMLPPGTHHDDWEGLVLVRGRTTPYILNQPVRWTRVKLERFFGMEEYRPHGYPVRVTTAERTLLDGLLHPGLCGGLETVLQAWAIARDILHLDTLVEYVERFDVGVLRQRVGFILDELDLSHPTVENWRTQANRGGSSKLAGSEGYSSNYDERWNLSINVPIDALHGDVS